MCAGDELLLLGSLLVRIYRVGQKVCLEFPISWYRKTPRNILDNPTFLKTLVVLNVDVVLDCVGSMFNVGSHLF